MSPANRFVVLETVLTRHTVVPVNLINFFLCHRPVILYTQCMTHKTMCTTDNNNVYWSLKDKMSSVFNTSKYIDTHQ